MKMSKKITFQKNLIEINKGSSKSSGKFLFKIQYQGI